MSGARKYGCSKSGDELLQVAQTLHSAVSEGVIERTRTASGLKLCIRRSPESEAMLHEFVRSEKECCPFFEFNLGEQETALSLEIVGAEEADSLLDLLFQLSEPSGKQARGEARRDGGFCDRLCVGGL